METFQNIISHLNKAVGPPGIIFLFLVVLAIIVSPVFYLISCIEQRLIVKRSAKIEANQSNDIELIEDQDDFCPCCDYNTFRNSNRMEYEICPICFWEDDPLGFDEPDFVGGANRVSLVEARQNFKEFGACSREMIKNVREPTRFDIRKIS